MTEFNQIDFEAELAELEGLEELEDQAEVLAANRRTKRSYKKGQIPEGGYNGHLTELPGYLRSGRKEFLYANPVQNRIDTWKKDKL